MQNGIEYKLEPDEGIDTVLEIGQVALIRPDQMPVMRPLPVTKRGERRRWELMEPWEFTLMGWRNIYIIPKGFIFDGASIPRLFWNMMNPTGYLFLAGLIHDFLYKYAAIFSRRMFDYDDQGKRIPGKLIIEHYNKEEADIIFRKVADHICMGEKGWTWIAKKALDIGGGSAWRKHREKNMDIEELSVYGLKASDLGDPA